MNEANTPHICEICGLSCQSELTSCPYCGNPLEEPDHGFPATSEAFRQTVAEFGFRLAETDSAIFDSAEALFLSQLSSEAAKEFGYAREHVLENDDAFYIPLGWIGCCGHLISKFPLHLISFGSYIGPETHLWAYYQGISMSPLGKDRKNQLRILSICDYENTVTVLKTFLDHRWLERKSAPRLSSLPVELNEVDLYFGISGLLQAKKNNWFQFEIS
ncbi:MULTISPECIES: hypothetical protein [unclassified Duganella]|uniref:hypothetical protein n=1 Tax=unclassified Duganella TaxID=2636909 RepID=UPI0012E38C48|nr:MULTISPECIES: hypothetical protein [unclassified Duganella]